VPQASIATSPPKTSSRGHVTYHDAGGALQTIKPDQIKAIVDPLGLGVDAAALAVLQKYPVGNNSSLGDGLNFTGYTFNAPIHSKQDTYTAKLDYKLDSSGKESLFWRGNLQNDHGTPSFGAPQFPGQAPNVTVLSNNKGMATGLTSVLRANLVSTFRYGFTRQGGENTGILGSKLRHVPQHRPDHRNQHRPPSAPFRSTPSPKTSPGAITRTTSSSASTGA
jgi:hypothetical protein